MGVWWEGRMAEWSKAQLINVEGFRVDKFEIATVIFLIFSLFQIFQNFKSK